MGPEHNGTFAPLARLIERMHGRFLAGVLLVLLLTACGGPGVLTPRSTGTVSGHVMSRLCGGAYRAQAEETPCAVRAMPDVKLTFHQLSGSTTSTATSDSSGAYRVDLPAGIYTVEVTSAGTSRFSGPKQVTVITGQTVTADFSFVIELL